MPPFSDENENENNPSKPTDNHSVEADGWGGAAKMQDEPPEHFCCPIGMALMSDPVFLVQVRLLCLGVPALPARAPRWLALLHFLAPQDLGAAFS